MKYSFKLSVLTLALVGLMAAPALAANPHIVGSPSATVSGNTLTVSASVAGLGNTTESADFSLVGEVNVSSRCYTRSGNTPQAANKQETIPVDATGTFPVSNGQTTGSISFTAPGSTLDCPRGQIAVVEGISFDGLVLSGEGLTYEF